MTDRVVLSLPFDADPAAQRFVADHPDGASQHEIAAATGVSHVYVGQLERRALAKLMRLMSHEGTR
jgi:DNA-directed RNA polymerase specialized sigma subunit